MFDLQGLASFDIVFVAQKLQNSNSFIDDLMLLSCISDMSHNT